VCAKEAAHVDEAWEEAVIEIDSGFWLPLRRDTVTGRKTVEPAEQ
jgi:hypothetical protein